MARISLPGRLAITVATIALVFGGPTAESRAASDAPQAPAAATSFKIPGELTSVVAFSPSNAWAAGYAGNRLVQRPLLVHWNGKAWSRWPSLTGAQGQINAMTGTSASDIWAVGVKYVGPKHETFAPLVLHFNGTAWSQQNTEFPGYGELSDVVAAAGATWAAGTASPLSPKPIIMHLLNGHWYLVPVALGAGSDARQVVATGTNSAIALADKYKIGSILLRWTGHGWINIAMPFGKNGYVQIIGPGHAGEVWAVGGDQNGVARMLWNGKVWKKVPIPAAYSQISMIRPIPGGTEWAVGAGVLGPTNITIADIEYWSGRAWITVPSGNTKGILSGVSASAKNNAWAVGGSTAGNTLILHYNGKAWG